MPVPFDIEELAQRQRERFDACRRTLASRSDPEAARLLTELDAVDADLVYRLTVQAFGDAALPDLAGTALASRAQPPRQLVRLPQTPDDEARWREARERGLDWLRAGKVGVIVVAGGQGTRLGSPLPKGMFPIGPLSGKTLFQWFVEQLQTRRRQTGAAIPYAVMTSAATQAETAAYFAEHRNFGLPAEDLRLFQQGHLPAVDAVTGVPLCSAPGELALSPDGHGGLLAALSRARILQDWADRGIETLMYHQVDNPCPPMCDPAFLGWHLHAAAEVSTKVVAKRSAAEKMGVLVEVEGVARIIEYSDLPADVAAATDDRGGLRIWAGNTAMHIFQREFLERALNDDRALPFHIARKIVPYVDEAGRTVTPPAPNAFKFERFIFDVLPWSRHSLIVEGNRADEFNPVKNQTGDDSPETARAALMALHRRWLRAAGVEIADDVPVEISPLVASAPEDLRGRFPAGTRITTPLLLESSPSAYS